MYIDTYTEGVGAVVLCKSNTLTKVSNACVGIIITKVPTIKVSVTT